MLYISKLKKDIQKASNPKQAKFLQRFFKTGKGDYGEGDIFLGLKVPVQREIVKKYLNLSFKELKQLIQSKIHEYRLMALFILINQYKKGDDQIKKNIFNFYLKYNKRINNWDLVDLSAPNIIGQYLLNKKRDLLYKLAISKNLWQRRISVLSTFSFIRNNQFDDSLKIAKTLLRDKHDLIHKAVGWMLREVGKRNQIIEEQFLKKYYRKMPRTMLRYAIEKFDQKKRAFYLKK